jgi:hypothetical protein
VWRPDFCRPLAALGPDPLSWSGGTLATKRFYLPVFGKTNEDEFHLVIGFTNVLPFCYDPAMGQRLELATKALAIERLATGGLAAIVPGRAIGAIATAGSDTETARYLARLLGIRQVVLGVMLWHSRDDRAWLRRMATLNALTEALDAAATVAAVMQRRDGHPKVAPTVAALATSAAFLALRAAAT